MAMDPYPKFKSEVFYFFGGMNPKASSYANSPVEFRDIQNLNFLYPGSLTKRPGSTIYIGTTVAGSIQGGIEFARLSGASYIIFAANTNLYSASPPGSANVAVTNLANQYMNFVTFTDRLFCCNGTNFFKFDGVNNYNFGLPPGATAAWGVTAASGGSLNYGVSPQTFFCAYSYINELGYVGPLSYAATISIGGTGNNTIVYYGITQPFSGYGITSIQLWRSSPGGINLYGTTQLVLGSTQVSDTNFPLGTCLAIPLLWFTNAPRFQAIYNNQYFMAGFSLFPSRVYWSDIGVPEAMEPTNYAEFRTNDGDYITGMKVFNGALVVAKQRSCHQIIGDNPTDFVIQEISQEYGSLSNQAMIVFENVLWMLDQKGICQFDGTNIGIVSDKPEPFFLGMNVPEATGTAVAAHVKRYNEIWFAIPIGPGASVNTDIIVYDYLSKAWTRYSGIQPSTLFIAQGNQSVKTVFYGGYTGGLFYVGSSFMGDNGGAITCMAFTRWIAPAGQTTDNLYRRFYMDIDPILGVTQTVNVQFYTNYSTNSIQYTNSIVGSSYQTRLDFGLPARTIAAQIFHSSATLPFKMNAFTFESMYLRSV